MSENGREVVVRVGLCGCNCRPVVFRCDLEDGNAHWLRENVASATQHYVLKTEASFVDGATAQTALNTVRPR